MIQNPFKLAGGGDFVQQDDYYNIPNQAQAPQVTIDIPPEIIMEEPVTNSFIQIASNVPWWAIVIGVISVVIGLVTIGLVFLSRGPFGGPIKELFSFWGKLWKGK